MRKNGLRVFSALSTALIAAQAVVEAQTLPEPPRPQQTKRVLNQSERTVCPPGETTLNQSALVQEQAEAEAEIAIDLLEPFAPLDGAYGPFAAHLFEVAGLEHEKRNYEILAIAADRATLAYVSAWPAPNQFFLNKTAALALSNALTLGNMEEADKFWQVFKETLSFEGVPADKIYECYPKLAQQLVWAGRLEEAELVASKLVSRFDGQKTDYIDSFHYTDYRYRQPVLKACAQVFAVRHAEEANALVAPLFEMEMDNLWLGDFCSKLGKLDKALACYQRAIAVEEKRSSIDRDNWYSCEQHCYALYQAAEIQRLQGKATEAKALLNQAMAVYRSTAAATQTSSTPKPDFRPTMADLEEAIANPVTKAEPVAPELPPSESVVLEMLPQFKLLTTINQAIRSGASSAAPIAQLLELYKKSPLVITADRPPLNYYCALLGIARRLSDHKLYGQSDDLLNNLLVIAPEHEAALGLNTFTVAELAINAERQGKNSATSWAKARKKIASLDQFASNSFRYLALAYSAAGDYERAQVVLKHAEQLCDSESAVKKNLRGRVLLLLDKANLAAAQDQFIESEACFKLALDQFVALHKGADDVAKIETSTGTSESSIPNSDQYEAQHRMDFDSKFMTKAVTLARINIEKKRVAAAERDMHKIMSLDWTAPSNSQITSLNTVQIYNLSPIKVELARLLFARGEFEKARALLSKTSESWDNSFGELCLFRADCAAAVKDWPTALDGYMTAPFQGQSINPPSAIPGFAEFSLNKALAASTHISAPDKSKLSSLYQSMAQVYEMAPYSPEQAVKFYRKAYEICPDNSSEKSKLAAKIAENERSVVSFTEEAKVILGKQLKDKSDRSNSPGVIKMLIQSAELGEKNRSEDRAILWFNVAMAETETGQLDSAIAHTQHGLDLIYRPQYLNGSPRILEQVGAIRSIADKGRPADAERLFNTALANTSLLYGANSLAVAKLQGELFSFFRLIKQDDRALALLDQIRDRDQNKLQYSGSADDTGISNIVPWNLNEITDSKEKEFYLKVLNKYLMAYKKYYSPDDQHIGQTLKQIALLESATNFESAFSNYQSALSIAKLYGDELSIQGLSTDLEQLLRKHNKNEEADKVLSDCRSFNKRIEGLNTPLQGKSRFEEQKKQIEFMEKQVPYSAQTKVWLYQSICSCEKSNDLAGINRLVPIALNAFKHSPEVPYNTDLFGWPPIHARCRLYKLIISGNVQHGNLDTAKKWLQAAIANKLEIPSLEESIFLAEMALECGDRNAALVFCKEAQTEYKADSNNNIYHSYLADLCKKLGITAPSDAVSQ
ncbi:MAG: hypothetical protein QG574_1895 [Cyanobacteriota bacterium erpe_2018_sw_21hr_WHONDRS-SW48-000092_B_bin.40]|nr:hypothetical protein [Cyanobacteriota bacterium erpe_2018_sw_21hr_WHONDRS-SW48-000092_B_bin.40]